MSIKLSAVYSGEYIGVVHFSASNLAKSRCRNPHSLKPEHQYDSSHYSSDILIVCLTAYYW